MWFYFGGALIVYGVYRLGRYGYSVLFPSVTQDGDPLAEKDPQAAEVPLTVTVNHALSLEERLINLCEIFHDFACADATTFENCIPYANSRSNPQLRDFATAYVEQIKTRVNKLSLQQQGYLRQASIPVLASQFTRQSLEEGRIIVEKAHGGACTNLAIAAAGRILKDFEEKGEAEPHIEIIARRAGRGSHVLVLVNRNPNTDLKNPASWNDDCYIVDAWAMAMGYSKGVYNGHPFNYGNGVYKKGDGKYPYIAMLENLECRFDNFQGLENSSSMANSLR